MQEKCNKLLSISLQLCADMSQGSKLQGTTIHHCLSVGLCYALEHTWHGLGFGQLPDKQANTYLYSYKKDLSFVGFMYCIITE